jgi:hypothetical protein
VQPQLRQPGLPSNDVATAPIARARASACKVARADVDAACDELRSNLAFEPLAERSIVRLELDRELHRGALAKVVGAGLARMQQKPERGGEEDPESHGQSA